MDKDLSVFAVGELVAALAILNTQEISEELELGKEKIRTEILSRPHIDLLAFTEEVVSEVVLM